MSQGLCHLEYRQILDVFSTFDKYRIVSDQIDTAVVPFDTVENTSIPGENEHNLG